MPISASKKQTSTKQKNTKKNNANLDKINTNKTNTKENNIEKTMTKLPILDNFQSLHELIKKQLPLMEKMELSKEIETLEKSEIYIQKKDIFPLIKNLVSGALKNIQRLSRKLTSDIIPQYIPLEKNDLHSCIKAEYNIKNKVESSGSGAFGDVFKTKGKKYTYAVKVINIDKQEDSPWNDGKDKLKQIESEATITRKMGELGIGPKIFDVYYCNDDNKPKYYFVMEFMNQGSLESYMEKNNLKKLPANQVKTIIAKLKKMHDLGYIHNDLHTGNVLVNKKSNGNIDFFISDFGLASDNDKQAKEDQERELKRLKNYLETGSWWGGKDNDKLDYLTKYIMVNYDIVL